MFTFNDALDRAIAKPVAKAYEKVTPRFVRTGISNAFTNLDTVSTIVNDAAAGQDAPGGPRLRALPAEQHARSRRPVRSGIGGRARIQRRRLRPDPRQVGHEAGPYLMLPILGPSTVRDAFARIADQYTYPVNYLEDDSTRYLIRGVDLLDLRAGLLDLDAQIERSYDRYAFVRNAWLQRREFQVTDGDVEDQSLELEEGMQGRARAGRSPTPAPEAPRSRRRHRPTRARTDRGDQESTSEHA